MATTSLAPGNGVVGLGTSGNPWTTIYGTAIYQGGVAVVTTDDARIPTTDENNALAGTSGAPSASNKFMTAADRNRVWFLLGVTGLLGGGATKLDGYSTTGISLSTQFAAMIIDDNSGSPVARIYELVAGTDVESSPNVIRPDDYAGGSNEKVWKLRNTSTAADALTVAFNPDNYTETAATMAGHLEGIDDKLALVLTTRAGIYRTMAVPGQFFHANTGTPTVGAITFGSIIQTVATLVDAASKSVLVGFRLPDQWDTSVAPKFKLEWSGLDTGDVAWSVQGALFDTAADLTGALGTAHTFVDTSAGSGYLKRTSAFSPTLSGTGRFCVLNIQRTGADAGDTMAASAYLHAVLVQYKESATEPAVW